MGFRSLRVINEDRVKPGEGFGTHPHRDMEIITYVLEGALEHKDSMGNGSIIRPGEIQIMSAGAGITHSEFNHSKDEVVRFLQIWILPDKNGLKPSYEQHKIDMEKKMGQLNLIASKDGRYDSAVIHQNLDLYGAVFSRGDRATHILKSDRFAWVQVVRGSIQINGQLLKDGDGAAAGDEDSLDITEPQAAEVLLFDLA